MLAAVWSFMCVHSRQLKGFAVNIEWQGLQVACCLNLTITQSNNIIKCSICSEQSQKKKKKKSPELSKAPSVGITVEGIKTFKYLTEVQACSLLDTDGE